MLLLKTRSSVRRRIRARVAAHLEDIRNAYKSPDGDGHPTDSSTEVHFCNQPPICSEGIADEVCYDNVCNIFDNNATDEYEALSLDLPLETNDTNKECDQLSESEWMEWNSEPDTDQDSSESSDNDSDDWVIKHLAQWSIEENIPQKSVRALLLILHRRFPGIPLDPRTLLSTPRNTNVKELAGGVYHHFGIASCLQNLFISEENLDKFSGCSELLMQCNIDGLPLFKSTGLQLWPILGMLKKPCIATPFIIGVYAGRTKPTNIVEFLNDFVNEASLLENTEINLSGTTYKFYIHSFVCDAPARSFLKCTKLYSGYYSCDRCIQSGKYMGRMTFPEINSPLRTNEAFNEMLNEEHHVGDVKSPLTRLSSMGMVTDFILDYMHVICLGVMRKLLQCWVKGPLRTRLSAKQVVEISERQKSMRLSIPSEFARKPRPLSELDRWKATEFRLFLLYTGPHALNGILHHDVYKHFLLLHVAISCLISSTLCKTMCNYAQKLLIMFVQHAPKLYGAEFVIYNVHSLIHIADDVRRFGALDAISSFPYENHLQSIKKIIRKPSSPLQQVIKRIFEKQKLSFDSCKVKKRQTPFCQYDHHTGPFIWPELSGAVQYKCVHLEPFKLSLSPNNNCILLNTLQVGVVQNIISKDSQIFVAVKLFHTAESFYKYPMESSKLNIFKVSHLQDVLSIFNINDVVSKCVRLPISDNEYLALPFL